jgi:CubicO group peptidase (beta-lactamase class C family)
MFAKSVLNKVVGHSTAHKLDEVMKAYHKQGRFSGAVLIAKGGHTLLRKGYGYAGQSGDWKLNTPQTAFRIGSMSKPFTAMVTMQLVQEGRLTLDAPLGRYLVDFPNGDSITIQHLLSNRSGIEDYISLPAYEQLQLERVDNEQLIALFRNLPLRFAPGADYGYSNSNWVLLAAIIEHVMEHPFAQVVTERVLHPAKMSQSGLDWTEATRPATGSIDTGAGMQPAPILHSSTMRGGGDIHATLDDLYRFDRAVKEEMLLPRALLEQMWTASTAMGNTGYGLGFETHEYYGHRAVGHSGGLPGFVSNWLHFDEGDNTIIVLSNLGSAAWESITEALTAILFDEPYELPTARKFVRVAPDVLMDYVGSYTMEYFGRTAILEFTVQKGTLVMHTHGLPQAALSALSETKFFGRSKGEVEFTFVREQEGHVQRIDVVWGGYALFAQRITDGAL